MNLDYKQLISRYIRAKDESKPHLMQSVFSENATLSMRVDSDNISFPADTAGVNDMTEVLVHKFNQSYENIYTLCLTDTWQQRSNTVKCRWLVFMSEKNSAVTRVGFGQYDWLFESDGLNLVSHLRIEIEDMQLFSEQLQPEIMSCMNNLSYPWVSTADVLHSMSGVAVLSEVRNKIDQSAQVSIDC